MSPRLAAKPELNVAPCPSLPALKQHASVVQASRQEKRHIQRRLADFAIEVSLPDGHRRAVLKRLVRTLVIVKANPGFDAGSSLAAIGIALKIDVLMFERAPGPLDETLSIQRPRPAIEMRMPAAASRPVKAALVNWLPWSVLKISDRPKRASASSSAEDPPL
jgi:hypothetical protein